MLLDTRKLSDYESPRPRAAEDLQSALRPAPRRAEGAHPPPARPAPQGKIDSPLPWKQIARLRECWFATARRSGFAYEDAEDLFQDSFLAALQGLQRVQAGGGRSRDEAFLAWFWGILRHKMISELRRRRRVRRHSETQSPGRSIVSDGPLATRVRSLMVLMERRAPDSARILQRRFFEGRELSELADELGVSVPTAWRRVQAALDEMRACAAILYR